MVKGIKFRRGTTLEHATFTGEEGEITVDITKDVAIVHDGVTAGGFPLVGETTTQRITNKDINATALQVVGVATASYFVGDGSLLTNVAGGGGNSGYANTSGVSTSVIGGIASVTQLFVSGITTVGFITATNLYVAGVGTFLSSGLKIRNPANTFGYTIAGGAIVADRTLTLPVVTSNTGIAVTGFDQTFTGTQTFSSINAAAAINFNTTQSTILIGTGQTTPVLTLGGVSQTGTMTLGQSTVSQITNIQAGVSGVGTTKTINLGTGGGSGSFTKINIGPTAGVGTVAINSGTNVGIGTTIPKTALSVGGSFTASDTRIQSVAEKTTLVNGNTVSLVYNTGGGNVAICTNPSGDITLNVTDIPTDSTFDNYSLAFSVIVTNTGTARSCTAINLNGVSETIRWFGGSLSAAIAGVTTSNGYDVYSFTGINTVGSASTTANYIVLGSVNGSYR